MSAKVNLGDKDEVELRSPTRSERIRRPSDKEVASCKPCRIVLMVGFIAGLIGMMVAAIVIIAVSPKCEKQKCSLPAKSLPVVWWKKGAAYQLDLASVGNLKGLKRTLVIDYLKEIGAKTVVIEGLYDPSNFQQLSPNVGSLNDLKEVVDLFTKKDIQLLMDFYPGYTSDKSSSFIDSRSNKTSSKRSWYTWKQNPNTNWKDNSNGNPWVFNNATGESYYQYYGNAKPALNYNETEVRKYLNDTLSFWLTKGIKGFNLNGVANLLVDRQLKNNTGNSLDAQQGLSGLHDILNEWQSIVSAKDGILMGTVPPPPTRYYGISNKKIELNTVVNDITSSIGSVANLNSTIVNILNAVPKNYGWPGWISGSLSSRLSSRASEPIGILLNVLLLTLPGTYVTYSGDELWLKAGSVPFNSSFNPAVKVFKQASQLIIKDNAFRSLKMDVLYVNSNVIVYYRPRQAMDSSSHLVALNFGNSKVTKIDVSASHPTVKVSKGIIVLDSLMQAKANAEIILKNFDLEAYQGLVVKVSE